MKKRDDRWQHLIHTAELLREAPSPQAAKECVESILEVFPKSLDPLDDFEGYAVRELVKALRDVLEKNRV